MVSPVAETFVKQSKLLLNFSVELKFSEIQTFMDDM